MCSPQVMEKVRASVNRRQFIGMVGAAGTMTALGAVAVSPRVGAGQDAATPVAVAPVGTPVAVNGFTTVRDLTHTVSPAFPMFPGAQSMEINTFLTVEENGFYKNELILDEHTGTHMDAPAHFAVDGVTADQLPVEQLLAQLAIIDITARAAVDPDSELTVDDILAWEDQHGPLPGGAFVAMYSGWEARLSDPDTFVNLDDAGVQHYPGFQPDTAAFLVSERDIVGIGVDTLSLDFGASQDFGTHLTVLPAGKYGLESLANLGETPPAGATIVVGGPKHLNASGGPTRAFALF